MKACKIDLHHKKLPYLNLTDYQVYGIRCGKLFIHCQIENLLVPIDISKIRTEKYIIYKSFFKRLDLTNMSYRKQSLPHLRSSISGTKCLNNNLRKQVRFRSSTINTLILPVNYKHMFYDHAYSEDQLKIFAIISQDGWFPLVEKYHFQITHWNLIDLEELILFLE